MADRNADPDPAIHGAIPIWNMETWLFEDLVIGQRPRLTVAASR